MWDCNYAFPGFKPCRGNYSYFHKKCPEHLPNYDFFAEKGGIQRIQRDPEDQDGIQRIKMGSKVCDFVDKVEKTPFWGLPRGQIGRASCRERV